MSQRIQCINPATGDVVKEYTAHTPAQAAEAAEKSHATFLAWRRAPLEERAEVVNRAADILLSRKDEFARLMTAEMGKLLKGGHAEIEKCASACRHYAQHGAQYLADRVVKTEASKSYVSYRPLGVVLAVMPWNFPFWQVFRFAAPTLMAGNAALLKHASNTPGSALAIEEVWRQAGLPEGVFKTLLLPSRDVEGLIRHPRVAAVTLTGSTPAGQAVASIAASEVKKSVLELGGSDAYIILKDADIARAARMCAESRLVNGGQSCISGKRFIVEAPVVDAFTQGLVEAFRAIRMGDPLDEASTLGPLARADLRDELHRQVERTVQAGASCLLGGFIPEGKGAYYPATVLSNVAPGMAAFEEEMFGPVASIIAARDEKEAIALANQSSFGLGGGIFTGDLARGERIAREEIESGCCFVNQYVRSDVRLPFGGVKMSGYGRELAEFGIHEFVNIKSVLVA